MSRPLQPRRIPPSFFEPRADTAITWLGMAGLLVNARGTILMVDPLITLVERDGRRYSESDLPLKLPFLSLACDEVVRADAVLYTHADNDHFGPQTAKTLHDRLKPKFLAPPPVLARLAAMGVPDAHLLAAHDFETFAIGSARVTITPALHDFQTVNPWRRGDCCGFLIRTPDGSVWHPGDTRLIDELLEIRDVDVLMFDVACGAKTHLGPAGSARLGRTSGARILLAYHYGTFEAPQKGGTWAKALDSSVDESTPFIKDMQAKFAVMDPGEILRLPLAADPASA
jgi:L-ascorbate metabolism protein UlaG (beta-lactamase superfamily)